MNVVSIPPEVLKLGTKVIKRYGNIRPWWVKSPVPPKGILARSTGCGTLKEGVTVYLIGSHNRNIYPNGEKMTIREYIGLTDQGVQPLVQLGRDVEMVD